MELEQTKDEISKIKEELDQQQKMKGNTHCCVFAGGGGCGQMLKSLSGLYRCQHTMSNRRNILWCVAVCVVNLEEVFSAYIILRQNLPEKRQLIRTIVVLLFYQDLCEKK